MSNYVGPPCVINHKYRRVKGVAMRLHGAACVATALGKSVGTVRRWERDGVMPRTPYIRAVQGSEHGRRLYSDEQLELIRWAAERSGVVGRKPFELAETGLPELLHAVWNVLFPDLAAWPR